MATSFTAAQMAAGGMVVKEHSANSGTGGKDHILVRSCIVDFDGLATNTGVALATGDVYPLLPVNVGEVIPSAGIDVLKVATGASDLDFGFTGGDTKAIYEAFIANDNGEVSTVTAIMAKGPIYVITTDTLDVVTATQTLAGAVLRFWALILRF